MATEPTPHRRVAVDDAALGQHLAEAVLDESGNVLVAAGCEITAKLMQALARRGVGSVCVVVPAAAGEAQGVVESDPAECRERVKARVAHLFRHATRQGRLNPLMHSVLQYRLGGTP